MKREEIFQEVKSMFGLVPSFLQQMPEETLALEWPMMKRQAMAEGPIPPKYRVLMGLAVASSMKCTYCIFHQKEFAKALGASEEEIEQSLEYAKYIAGWSAYISGLQPDVEQFKDEVRQVARQLRQPVGARR